MFINRALKQCLIAAPLTLITACGGSSTSAPEGNFSLAVTDGPIDSAAKVVVEFSGVSVKPADGEVIEFTFDAPITIDLLMLQGQVSQYILAGETIPAGDYEWIRLAVNAELDGTLDSYIELNDGSQLELWIPGGAETGLKLVSGFTVPEEGDVDFTVDFDLRKSIVIHDRANAESAMLKPTLRIVDTFAAGSIEGEIDAEIIAEHCAEPEANSGAVYVFEGNNKARSDVRGGDADPIASALVSFDDGAYRYELGFVAKGSYSVVFTCDAALDDAETEDELTFVEAGRERINVSMGENVIVDFVHGESAPAKGERPDNGKPESEKPEGEKPEAPEAPEGETPEVDAPEVPKDKAPKPVKPEAPEVEAPKPEKPEVPEIEAPKAPKPEKPEAPEVEEPEVDAPKPVKPETPEVDAPKAPKPAKPEAPEVDVPEIDVPEVEVPEVDLPEVETPEVPVLETPVKGRPDHATKDKGDEQPKQDKADEEQTDEVEAVEDETQA